MRFFEFLERLPWMMGVSISVLLFIAFAIGGLLLVRRSTDQNKLRKHHDVAGYVYTNLGVLYGVLLGFTVVNAQQRFDKIKETAQIEAGYLIELYRDAEVFSNETREEIRSAIRNYTEIVINQEWKMMAEKGNSINATHALNEVWRVYYEIQPATKKEEIWYGASINKLNQLTNARFERLLGSKESLGAEMWTFLILGGIILVAFTWFFGLENLTSHILLASVLAASTAFLLFLISSLDTAFTGDVNIAPEAFERVLDSFKR